MKSEKKIWALLLACAVTLSLTACASNGGTDSKGTKDTASGGSKWDYSSLQTEQTEQAEQTEQTEALTLDDVKVRFVYEDEGYLLLAYYGPQENISMSFCKTDGSTLSNRTIAPYYWEYDNNWRLLQTEELPEGYSSGNIALRVADYSSDEPAEKLITEFGEPMTDEELKEIGVAYVNGYPCNVSSLGFFGEYDVTIYIEFLWLGEYHKTRLASWPFSVDDFTFYSSDGTPLEEAFEGFEMDNKIKTRDAGGGQLILVFEPENNCDSETFNALVSLEPYMIFAADDGSTQRFELLTGYRE